MEREEVFVPKSYAETMAITVLSLMQDFWVKLCWIFPMCIVCIELHIECGLASNIAFPLALLCLPARSTPISNVMLHAPSFL
jgi:hypothetical protein